MGLKQQIVDVLQDSEKPLTLREIMERIPLNTRLAPKVSSSLCKLKEDGAVFVGKTDQVKTQGPGRIALYAIFPSQIQRG